MVAVIGAGRAGRAFALACAAAGFDVVLEDVMPANLRQAEADFSDLQLQTAGLLRLASTVEDAVHSADLAVDFVPDDLESKLEILSLLDRMAPPRTVLCTPTEHIGVTDLASCTYRGDRILALRGFFTGVKPRLLYPASVSAEVLGAATGFFETLHTPVAAQPDPDLPMLTKNVVYTGRDVPRGTKP